MDQNRNPRRNQDNDSSWTVPAVVGGVLGSIAAVAGGLYLYSRTNKSEEQPTSTTSRASTSRQGGTQSRATTSGSQANVNGSSTSSRRQQESAMSDLLSNMLRELNTNEVVGEGRRGVPRESVPPVPRFTNINGLIDDIYLRYIALNDEDFQSYYGVMHGIFLELHRKMKEVDPYYNKYSSKVQFAGSHPDRLRINKPDEFDIDIVIGLPLCSKVHPLNPSKSDFIFEPREPGFIQLKTGVQFERLPYRDSDEWQINRAAHEWRDDKGYLLRSKFMDWFKSVVNRALNEFPCEGSVPVFRLDGVVYKIRKSESGPAMTLYVENANKGFKLDVDLVPALRFPIGRWPVSPGYRVLPRQCASREDWMVVPKPNKAAHTEHDKERSWRIALHEQEGEIMYNTNHMRQAIRLIKKLRDAQGMNKIASYYIKTLFFWEAMEKDREFWNNNPVDIFKHMVKKFHEALVAGKISYFWNKGNNLIGAVDRSTLNRYANIVGQLVEVLACPDDYKKVAKFLLTREEYIEYERFL